VAHSRFKTGNNKRNTSHVRYKIKRMANWQMRRANLGDTDALSSCIDAAYSIYAARVTDLPAVSEGIADDIADHRVWVAEIDREIVGGIVLMVEDGHLLLANVAVHPKRTGLGIGRGLMARADTDCRALGLRELRLSTHVQIPENVALYTHLGWEETGRTGNKVLMRKLL